MRTQFDKKKKNHDKTINPKSEEVVTKGNGLNMHKPVRGLSGK